MSCRSYHAPTLLTEDSIPTGIVDVALVLAALPADLRHGQATRQQQGPGYIKRILQRIDGLGTVLLLGASLLLITALQLAGDQYAWSSSVVVALLVIAAILFASFFTWEYMISNKPRRNLREPVFPWRFFSNRVWLMMLL